MRKLAFLLLALSFGTISKAQTNTARMLSGVNAQTGTTYTFVCTDATKLVTFSNSSPQTASLFAATDPCSGPGIMFSIKNIGTAVVTITPASGTIDGGLNLQLQPQQGADLWNDGINYFSQGGGVGGGGAPPRLDQVLDPNVDKAFNLGVTNLSLFNGNVSFAGTSFVIPNSAGCTATATGQICLDTTLLNVHLWNGADTNVALFPAASTFTSGDVLGVSVVAGQKTLQDLAPVNASTGNTFWLVNMANPISGDIPCWDTGGPPFVNNCTPGAVDTSIAGATNTYAITSADQMTTIDHDFAASVSVTVTLPTADTLDLNPGFVFVYSNHSTLIDDVVSTTWTINSFPDLPVNPNSFCRIRVDPASATNWIADCANIGPPTATAPFVNGLISGGGVVWKGLLNFTVSAATYAIAGTQYTSPQTNLTLTAADPTNPRIDVIAVNTSGAAVVITGTPAANPAAPSVDPTSQLSLTFVTIPALSTVPTITNITVYDENLTPPTEWTCSGTAAFNCASTNNPFHLTKDIEVTGAVASGNVLLTNSTPVSLSSFSALSFNIRNKATWASNTSVSICFLNGASTIVGSCIGFKNGVFGFNQTNTTTYQQIVIPISQFSLTGNVDRLRFQVVSNTGSIGFYLDWIQIQSNLAGSPGGQNFQLQVDGANTLSAASLQDTGCTTFTASNASNGVTNISTHVCHGLVFNVGDPGNTSALTVASTTTSYLRVPFACTIKDYSLMIDGGTITVKFWKVATGTAIPTSGNSINTSGVGISSGTAIRSTTLSDFTTTSVAANDFMAMNVTAVATAKFVNGVLNCQE